MSEHAFNRTGGAAFPGNFTQQDGDWHSEGMSKREWYAGQALAAMAGTTSPNARPEHIAAACFQVADAMLREGNK